MKILSVGLVFVITSTAFSSEPEVTGNCVLNAKEKGNNIVIVMPWVGEKRTMNLGSLPECIEAGEKFLDETFNFYEGNQSFGKGSYRVVKFRFTTDNHTIEGKIHKNSK